MWCHSEPASIEPHRLTKQLIAWGPAAAWAAVLFSLSALPEWPSVAAFFDLPDKLVHFGVYVVLGAALAHARHHGAPGAPHALLVALGAAYGASDEWHQSFVPGRTPSAGDWLADAVGVVVGYFVAWTIAVAVLRRLEVRASGSPSRPEVESGKGR